MKINKIISFILTFIILAFSLCPLAFASDNDNLIDFNMSNWVIEENGGLLDYVNFVGGSENLNRVYFNSQPTGSVNAFALLDVTDVLLSGKNYNFNFDAMTYGMNNVIVQVGITIRYNDGSDDDYFTLVEFGESSTTPNYVNYNANFTPHIENKGYHCFISFFFGSIGSVGSNRYCYIKNLSLTEIESQEGNILKRIYNFIINLPATFQNFFTDLKNGISGFFTDLKTNLSTWFNNLKNSIGGFFTGLTTNLSEWFNNLKTSIGDFIDNLSDNLSDFFTKLKNWLLWFNAEGSSSYVNPFEQIDDDVDDDIESNIVKLANYITDNTDTVSVSLATIGSAFLVFDSFVVGIPLVLSLIIFAFFIHILKRLLGY